MANVCQYAGQSTPENYVYPEIPDSILHFVEGIQTQTDVLTGLSGAGFALTIVIWTRVRGLALDIDLTGFRGEKLLMVSFLLFGLGTVVGYVISSYLTGYLAEIATGWNGSKECYITDARQHLIKEYFVFLRYSGVIQLLFSALGVVTLGSWAISNVCERSEKGAKR